MYNFKDKVVLITGGANGIGKCFAKNFAAEGAKLVLVDINADNLAKTKDELNVNDDHIITVQADVSEETEIVKYVNAVKEKFGHIDVFCNNAGMTRNKLIKETKIETLKKVWGC